MSTVHILIDVLVAGLVVVGLRITSHFGRSAGGGDASGHGHSEGEAAH